MQTAIHVLWAITTVMAVGFSIKGDSTSAMFTLLLAINMEVSNIYLSASKEVK